jgi:molybdenum cofactor synthesis domain-containing protein
MMSVERLPPPKNRTVAVITVSDSASGGLRKDVSGAKVAEVLRAHKFKIVSTEIVADEVARIQQAILRGAAKARLVVTTGGTGIAARDVTPEATRPLCEKLIEGIAERMRSEGAKKTAFAALSRGVCGIRSKTLIVNLPGSPSGAVDSLQAVIDQLLHAMDLLAGNTEHTSSAPSRD